MHQFCVHYGFSMYKGNVVDNARAECTHNWHIKYLV